MVGVEETESLARGLLAAELSRRWAHVGGVAARVLERILGDQAEVVQIAAWLHDIGYSSAVRSSGFHPLDGARHLRDVVGADNVICRLVAHHTGALVEAEERGIVQLAEEFALPEQELLEALTYCDSTGGVDGVRVGVEERLSEILTRYPSEHVVHRSIVRSSPALRLAARNVQRRLIGVRRCGGVEV